jgi:hypothetical protein
MVNIENGWGIGGGRGRRRDDDEGRGTEEEIKEEFFPIALFFFLFLPLFSGHSPFSILAEYFQIWLFFNIYRKICI